MSRLRNKAATSVVPKGVACLQGNCFLFDETGFGMGFWAFEEINAPPGEIHILDDGDELVIFSDTMGEPGADEPVWSGHIQLMEPSSLEDSIFHIKADQRGIDALTWLKWFVGRHPAKLIATVHEDTGKWL
jgi:hypothetical protein